MEEALLEGPRRYTHAQVASLAGLDEASLTRLWRAMGFPDPPDGSEAFTESDVVAARRIAHLIERGVFDEGFATGVTRAMGHHLARLVEWQYVAFGEHLAEAEGIDAEAAGRAAIARLAEHLNDFEAIMLYVWRRQLAATSTRVLAGTDRQVARRRRTVGFADLVSYTRLAQRLGERELAALVDRFESVSADVIAAHGGRLVKTVGDEVLFLVPTPVAAAQTALDLADTMEADEIVPRVRVGLATGLVLTRLGDVFGTVVNLASRLTGLAGPGTVVVDPETAAALAADPRFALTRLRPRTLRGLGPVVPSLLTWGRDAGRVDRAGGEQPEPNGLVPGVRQLDGASAGHGQPTSADDPGDGGCEAAGGD